MHNIFSKSNSALFIIILIGIIFRFYNLNWGSPFYFHPDERNIASAITQLNFPGQMNPHFFAYGSLPIYTIYFTNVLLNILFFISNTKSFDFNPGVFHVTFEQAIIGSRFFSALFSVLLIATAFRLGRILKNNITGILSAFFLSTSIGLIQYSHFGTIEIWLTYCSTFLFLSLVKYLKTYEYKYIITSLITLGLLISIKISSVVLITFPLLILIYVFKKKRILKSRKLFLYLPSIVVLASAFIFLISLVISPYNLLDYSSFKNTINYESSVVIGTMQVFYTQGFYNTIPILFQLTKIYPFLLNPIMSLLLIPSLIYINFQGIKKRNIYYCLLFTIFYLLFFSQAIFYAKWTRYMVPTLPFIYLIISISLTELFSFFKNNHEKNLIFQYIGIFVMTIIFVTTIFYSVSFFYTVYLKGDTRVSASIWASKNIPSNSLILSETYDLGIIPFNPYFQYIKLFNFYDMDSAYAINDRKNLQDDLARSDYIILPSQRVLKSRLTDSEKFYYSSKFYKDLFSGNLGFEKIYETPCDIFCKIVYGGNQIFSYEETTNVFDRPTLFIFKKDKENF